MRTSRLAPWLVLPLLAALLLPASCRRATAGAAAGEAAGTAAAAPAGAPAEGGVEAFGVVRCTDVRHLGFDLPARVLEVRVRAGERVTRGQTLLVLDLGEPLAQVRGRRHELRLAALELERIERGFRDGDRRVSREAERARNLLTSAEQDLRRLREEHARLSRGLREGTDPELLRLSGDLDSAVEQHERALQELKDREFLRRDGAISQSALLEFREEVRAREKAVQDARLALESWRQGGERDLRLRETGVQQKGAEVENLRLQLEATRTEGVSLYEAQKEKVDYLRAELEHLERRLRPGFLLEDRVVSELANAVVADLACQPGDLVDPEKWILGLQNLDTLVVEADVPEDFIRDIRPGAPARIVPVADPDRSYAGRVVFISGTAADRGGQTVVPVQVLIEAPDGFLKPSFNVDVTIERATPGAPSPEAPAPPPG